MSESRKVLQYLRKTRVIIAVLLILVYAGATAYYVLSETSVRGLTVKIYSASRNCTVDPETSQQVVNYSVTALVWSSTSLQTSLRNVQFTLSVDRVAVGVQAGTAASFAPGGGATYSLAFKDPSLSPTLLPQSSELLLTISADVQAGIVGSSLTRSDGLSQDFGSVTC